MQPAATGTDQRLDKMTEQLNAITAQNDRQIEQLGQIIDIGLEAIAAIKALLPDEPATINAVLNVSDVSQVVADAVDGIRVKYDVTQHSTGEPIEIKEPARKRKKP